MFDRVLGLDVIDPDLLPWSEAAEQSVLGALLLDNQAWDQVADILQRRSFFSARHGLIFETIAVMVNACKAADVITVHDRLQQLGRAAEVGGLEYLNALSQSVPSSANVRRHAELIAERYTDRALRETADLSLTVALGKGEPQLKLADIIERFDTLQRGAVRAMPVGLESIVVRRLDAINDMATTGEPPLAWSTGFPKLDDHLLGGFMPGKVYMLAGRPSVGKSSLAHWMSLHAAVRQGAHCLYLSQEMPEDELGDRSLAMLGKIDYARLQLGTLLSDEWGKLAEASEQCARAPFFVDDQTSLRGNDIRVKARYVKGLNLLVLDYVQLCQGAEEGEQNRNAELEVISRAIKTFAKTAKCAVLVLSQLARRVEDRAHKRAIPSDLKDCGGLEQDADVIMSLWPIQLDRADGYSLIGLDILKNRAGRKNVTAVLEFHPHRQGWEESAFSAADLITKSPAKRGLAKEI